MARSSGEVAATATCLHSLSPPFVTQARIVERPDFRKCRLAVGRSHLDLSTKRIGVLVEF
eukprot:5802540-Pyramimonas_sp.AAC.1